MPKKRNDPGTMDSNIITQMSQDEDEIDEKLIRKEEKIEENIIWKVYNYFHLHLDNYETSHGRWLEGFLFVVNFLAIVHFMIDTHAWGPRVHSFLILSEIIFVSIFILEYAARMWVASKKVKHFFNIYSLIDLMVIIPALISFANVGFLRIFRILRVFRVIRVVRVLRFQRIFRSTNTVFGKFTESKLIIVRIVLTLITIIFVSSGLIWAIESRVNPNQFSNIWSAIYFSVVTMTTVGYGDITPLSGWGKAVTVIMILSGVALIPWQVGKLIRVLVVSHSKYQTKCKKCGLIEHDFDALHCKNCGTILKRKKRIYNPSRV
jgi:voltage-gated potassium channel